MPRKPSLTREQILEVAIRLFSQKGYKGTTMEALAKALKIKKASLYYHFPSKRELYRESLRRLYQEIGNAFASFMSERKEYLDRAQEIVLFTLSLLSQDRALTHLAFRSLLDRDRTVFELLRNEGKILMENLKVFVELGIKTKKLKDLPPSYLLLAVLGVCIAPFLSPELTELLTGKDPFDPDSQKVYEEVALTLLLGGFSFQEKEAGGKVVPLTKTLSSFRGKP